MRPLAIAEVTEGVDATGLGFVVEINGRAVLTLRAASLKRARALCAEPWFAEELAQYRSEDVPIWPAGAVCLVRPAGPEETVELRVALAYERAENAYEDFVFAFLVPLDLRPN